MPALSQRIARRSFVAGLLNIPFCAEYANAFLYGMGVGFLVGDTGRLFPLGLPYVNLSTAVIGAFFGLLSAPAIGICFRRPRRFCLALAIAFLAGVLICFLLGALQPIRVDLALIILCVLTYMACAFIISRRMEPICRRGFCSQCDYDLTGNTSGNCPECGQPIRQSKDDWSRYAR
ncbi:MAG: hypothetical protein J5J06_02375 [Phycisphaerae bacterium]|nr:hypothetical protein [Phycisphaerae bacterium]